MAILAYESTPKRFCHKAPIPISAAITGHQMKPNNVKSKMKNDENPSN